jgi:uncharacterized protein YlzI (FlbEa/FlbD family)
LITLTSANTVNDDPCDVNETAIEYYAVVSSAAVTFTQIGFSSGNVINVKQSVQEIRDAIRAAPRS